MAPSIANMSETSSFGTYPVKSLPHETYGKVVVERHRGLRLLLRYWIHVAATGFSVLLATLNFRDVALMGSEYPETNVVLNLFQFTAKAHELLILGSLSLVLLDLVRRRLTQDSGVPLGYVLSPALFNDLGWLTSRHFWSCLNASISTLPFVVFVLVAIALANLSGPLSAITVVPRLGWTDARLSNINPEFWNSTADEIWPSTIPSIDLPPLCSGSAADQTILCPQGQLNSVLVGVTPDVGNGMSCTTLGQNVECNTTTSNALLAIKRQITVQYDILSQSVYTTTPTAVVYENLAARYALGLARHSNVTDAVRVDATQTQLLQAVFVGDGQMYKPLVNTTCQELSYSDIFDLTQQNAISANWSKPFVTWLDNVNSSDVRPSFVFAFMKNDTAFQAPKACHGQECYTAISCSIDARLAPLSLWANTAQTSLLYQSDPQPKKFFQSPAAAAGRRLTLKKSWLDAAFNDPKVNITMDKVIPAILNFWETPMEYKPIHADTILNVITEAQPLNFTQGTAIILGSVIAETIGMYPTSFAYASVYTGDCSFTQDIAFPDEVCNDSVSHWVHTNDLGDLKAAYSMIKFTARRNVYGWFINSITVKLALAVLLLHASCTAVYLIHVLLFRKTITRCWETAPELLVLALNSLRAPLLMGSSTRIKHPSIWREPVTIRQVLGEDDLSLIVGDSRYYSGLAGELPEVGRKYD